MMLVRWRVHAGPPASMFLAVASLACALPVGAQGDTLIAPGAHYEAGSLHRFLLGVDYRPMWTTPVRVAVLDLDTFAGGLTPVRRGGFKQTQALRLRGADGREYNFRSVDKQMTRAMPPYARGTAVEWLRQDQVSAQLPVAPLVASALLDAAGVLNPRPSLVVMPDDARLGEFRAEFAGMLGTIEVHPDEGRDGQTGFAGAVRVAGTDRLLERLLEDGRDQVDERAFLRARLMDLVLGDWDRHSGNWRWARFDRDGLRWWVPVPEDRDYAFVAYNGALIGIARMALLPRLVRFGERHASPEAMLSNSAELTRRFLSGLDQATWDSVAAELRSALTDSAIDAAVHRMPAPYVELYRARLAGQLRARRDALPAAARALYGRVALVPELDGTRLSDVAEIEHLPGGVRVRLYAGAERGERVLRYDRVLAAGTTREVRVFLRGGADTARVSGVRGTIRVRVIGGPGDDFLEDRSRGPTAFYDALGENRLVPGPATRVDTRPFEPPPGTILPRGDEGSSPPHSAEAETDGESEETEAEDPRRHLLPRSARDWGGTRSPFALRYELAPNVGPVVGVGPSSTTYGFRRHPYARRSQMALLVAPAQGRWGVEYRADSRAENRPRRLDVSARASNFSVTRFHGFGNQSPLIDDEEALVWNDRAELAVLWRFGLGGSAEVMAGPVAAYTRPSLPDGAPASALPGALTGEFGEVGAQLGFRLESVDDRFFPRRGVVLRANGTALGVTGGPGTPYGRLGGSATAYLSPAASRAPVLALRAGGRGAIGDFPLHSAAFLGGATSLRGYAHDRFAGDAAAFGGAELRVPLFGANLLLRGTVGASAFAEAGRVWYYGHSSGDWHTSHGGGIWFATPVGVVGLHHDVGEARTTYVRLGVPF